MTARGSRSSEGGRERRLERLAVGRVEELKNTRCRRTAIEYLDAAAGHYRGSSAGGEVVVLAVLLTEFDVAFEHDEDGRAGVTRRRGPASPLERHEIEPKGVRTSRLRYRQHRTRDDLALDLVAQEESRLRGIDEKPVRGVARGARVRLDESQRRTRGSFARPYLDDRAARGSPAHGALRDVPDAGQRAMLKRPARRLVRQLVRAHVGTLVERIRRGTRREGGARC